MNRPPKQHRRLVFGERIGSGAFGQVFRAQSIIPGEERRTIAVKILPVSEENETSVESEAQILASLNHPNIVQCLGYGFASVTSAASSGRPPQFCIELELCDGSLEGDIKEARQQRKRFVEEHIWTVLQQLISALQYLDLNEVIHRDLKPANVLYKGDLYKISDFGLAKIVPYETSSAVGDVSCRSPQILKGEPYTRKTDIWSLGCVIFEMIELRRPFEGKTFYEIAKKIDEDTPEFSVRSRGAYSKRLRTLVLRMLEKDEILRPGLDELNQAVNLAYREHRRRLDVGAAASSSSSSSSSTLASALGQLRISAPRAQQQPQHREAPARRAQQHHPTCPHHRVATPREMCDRLQLTQPRRSASSVQGRSRTMSMPAGLPLSEH